MCLNYKASCLRAIPVSVVLAAYLGAVVTTFFVVPEFCVSLCDIGEK